MAERGAESAAGLGAGLVLVTLGSGQFLMTLDSSVMNVAIATVAKGCRYDGDRDPDGDHALHAGHGDADDPRWQGGLADRAQARLLGRVRDLRCGLTYHGPG
jgi:hypothetical protein